MKVGTRLTTGYGRGGAIKNLPTEVSLLIHSTGSYYYKLGTPISIWRSV